MALLITIGMTFNWWMVPLLMFFWAAYLYWRAYRVSSLDSVGYAILGFTSAVMGIAFIAGHFL